MPYVRRPSICEAVFSETVKGITKSVKKERGRASYSINSDTFCVAPPVGLRGGGSQNVRCSVETHVEMSGTKR